MNEPARELRDDDEIEIDLRKYAQRIWDNRLIIVSLAVIGALLGGLFSVLVPAGYEATASVAIIKTRTEVEFDPRVKTLNADDISGVTQTAVDLRRNSLLSLASSGEIADMVLKDIGPMLTPEQRDPAKLIRMVKAELAQRGDLILIKSQYGDPVVAAQIANIWATHYEEYINRIYGASQPAYLNSVQTEVELSRQAYETTQRSLEELIATNDAGVLQRQISDTQTIIDSLSQERLNSLSAAIQTRLNVQTQVIDTYLNAQREASTRVISEAISSQVRILSAYYDTKIELSKLVSDAQALRDQVAQGGANSVRSNNLAIVLLKARAFARLNTKDSGNATNSFDLQLNVGDPGATDPPVEEVLRDLDALVAVLKARQQSVEKDIATSAGDLTQGKSLTTSLVTGKSALQDAALQQFEQMVNLKDLADLVPQSAMASDAALATLIDKYSRDLDKAKSGLEATTARLQDLTEQRNLNRDAYVTLLKKQNEVRIGNTLTGTEVRFASPAVVPDLRVTSRILPIAIGAAVGLLLGILFALFRNATGTSARMISKAARSMVTGR